MKKILAFILTVNLIFVFTACGKDKNQTEQGTDDTVQEKQYSLSWDDVLSIFSYKPDTLCPIISQNNANLQMLNTVFEGLIQPDAKMLPQPWLAEKWLASEDGLEWSVTLRNDVKWHDGTAFTARDVVYTVNQIKNNPASVYAYNVSYIEAAETQGQNEVKFRLTTPNPNFISLLYFPVIKYSDADVDTESYRPVGTGAFVFEDRNEGNAYYLKRNDNWWNGKTATEEIKIKLLPDKDTAVYAFTSGEVDMTLIEDVNKGQSVHAGAASTVEINTPIYSFMGINHGNTVLAMEEVRAAISHALDRSKIVSEVMVKHAVQANAPVRNEWFVCGERIYEFKQNTKVAHEKLTEKGWKLAETKYEKKDSGITYRLKFDILVNEDNQTRVSLAHAIEKNLEEFGMNITVTKVPYETYIERIGVGQYETFIGSFMIPADIYSGFALAMNYAPGFYDEELSAAMLGVSGSKSQDETVQKYETVISRFNRMNPVIGLMFENRTMLYSKSISGNPTPTFYNIYNGIEELSVKGADGE